MANNSTTKSYKISQLPEMLSSDISDDDLFMMSDYNGGECKSKKLNFNQLNASIAQSSQIKNEINTSISAQASGGVIQEAISSQLSVALQILDGGGAADFT